MLHPFSRKFNAVERVEEVEERHTIRLRSFKGEHWYNISIDQKTCSCANFRAKAGSPTHETRFLAEAKVAALAPTSAMICPPRMPQNLVSPSFSVKNKTGRLMCCGTLLTVGPCYGVFALAGSAGRSVVVINLCINRTLHQYIVRNLAFVFGIGPHLDVRGVALCAWFNFGVVRHPINVGISQATPYRHMP